MTYNKERTDDVLILAALVMAQTSLDIKPIMEGKPNAVVRTTALKSVKRAIKILNNRLDEVKSATSPD